MILLVTSLAWQPMHQVMTDFMECTRHMPAIMYLSFSAVLMLTLHSKQADKHLHGHSAIQQSNTNAGPRARFQALDGICMQRSNCFTEGLADQPLFKGQLMQKSQLLYFRFSHCSPTSR